MFNSDAEARAFTLGDLALVRRLKSRGISMDSETYLSSGLHTMNDATLSRLPLGNLGKPTVVVRYGSEQAFGQFRHQEGDPHAHIVFMAPVLPDNCNHSQEGAWMLLLDTVCQAAGKRGAHNIHAEVDENSAVYEALRRAGFASYARQDIWRRDPAPLPVPPTFHVRRATRHDLPAIRYLHDQTVPRLAQKADPTPSPDGLLCIQDGRARAYIAVSRGNRGLYLKPYLHMDDAADAPQFIGVVMSMLERATRMPTYCCLRQYQSWLGSALEMWGFQPWARQTVMFKHTTARVERPAFAPLPAMRGIIIHGGPTSHCQVTDGRLNGSPDRLATCVRVAQRKPYVFRIRDQVYSRSLARTSAPGAVSM